MSPCFQRGRVSNEREVVQQFSLSSITGELTDGNEQVDVIEEREWQVQEVAHTAWRWQSLVNMEVHSFHGIVTNDLGRKSAALVHLMVNNRELIFG